MAQIGLVPAQEVISGSSNGRSHEAPKPSYHYLSESFNGAGSVLIPDVAPSFSSAFADLKVGATLKSGHYPGAEQDGGRAELNCSNRKKMVL